jgi:hypothetical protein
MGRNQRLPIDAKTSPVRSDWRRLHRLGHPITAIGTAIEAQGTAESSDSRVRIIGAATGRSMIGWRLLSEAAPNAAHHELVRMERVWREQLVTQAVDGLHQQRGAKYRPARRIARVLWPACGAVHPRREIPSSAEAANSEWLA